jgi:hypothetical protein
VTVIRNRERHIRAESTEYGPMLVDQNNILLTKKEALEWLHLILKSYENENLEQIIDYSNRMQSLYLAGYELEEKGRYFRFGRSVFKFKMFREDLVRNWSFKSKWCSRQVSTKVDTGYHKIVLQ